MAISKTETVLIKSTDTKGSGLVEYDKATNIQTGSIQIKWLGATLSFSSVSDYRGFINDVVVPLTNTIWSPSGTGAGFVAATVGTPGSDKISN